MNPPRKMGRPRVYPNAAARQRAYRQRKKAGRVRPQPPRPPKADTAKAVAEWARQTLVIPPGHPRAGRPFELQRWQVDLIRDALTHRETCLCVARKNSKSALIAVLVLSYLVGPLRRSGWRCGVLSASRIKASELLRQCEEIAAASSLEGLQVKRTPWPGKLLGDGGSTCEIEGAGFASGHSAGYDLAVVDELGLLPERCRAQVNGMRTSTSARNGRFLSLSIHGGGPFIDEILQRRGSDDLAVHHYAGDPDLPIDDPENWRKANPGLSRIKSYEYMKAEAARVLQTPADQAAFRAHDLNLPGAPAGELIVGLEAWKRCEVSDPPGREGPVFVGLDLGAHKSFTSAACWWPESGLLEVMTACPSRPGLPERGRSDAVGSLYERAAADGILTPLDGILTPVGGFLERLRAHLSGERVARLGADRFRHAELVQHLDDLGIGWRVTWRGGGSRSAEDAAADVRAFQVAVDGGKLKTRPNLLLLAALGGSTVIRDAAGRVTGLKQARIRARIDTLQAAVIALGLAAGYRSGSRAPKVHVAGGLIP